MGSVGTVDTADTVSAVSGHSGHSGHSKHRQWAPSVTVTHVLMLTMAFVMATDTVAASSGVFTVLSTWMSRLTNIYGL